MVGNLRNAGLSPAYRRNLHDASLWLLGVVRKPGGHHFKGIILADCGCVVGKGGKLGVQE